MIALAKELSRQRSCAMRARQTRCARPYPCGSHARGGKALHILDANQCLCLRQERRRRVLAQFAYFRAGPAARCTCRAAAPLKEFSDVALFGRASMPLGVGVMRAAKPLATALAVLLSAFVAGLVYARDSLTGLFLGLKGWSGHRFLLGK